MKQGTRAVFKNGIYQHIYQRSDDRSIIFKNSIDAIYYISVFHKYSLLYKIETLAFCLMDNHIHALSRAAEPSKLHDFIRVCTATFVKGYNSYYKRKGSLFQRPFGSAPKSGSKSLRTCISYINNNPVEASKVKYMEQYTWNLFAYADSCYPFSDKLVLRKSSKALRIAIKEVSGIMNDDGILSQMFLKNVFVKLNEKEKKQLRDYILKKYSLVNYNRLESIFGSFEEARHAMHSFIGKEYDLKCE